jgi:hypothetical protein
MFLGGGGAGWSAADNLLENHTVKVTLLTSRGRIVLLHKSPDKPEELQDFLAPLLERITASGRTDPLPS